MKFKDPQTGQIINVNQKLVYLCCLLLGPFFFLNLGEIIHFIMGFIDILLVASGGVLLILIHVAYAIFSKKIVREKWKKKGYQEIDEYGDPLE